MDDIDKVRDFIKARVTPLRDASYDAEDRKALQALLDLATVTRGVAESQIRSGEDPVLPYFYLCTAARQWHDHPDFLPEWKNG